MTTSLDLAQELGHEEIVYAHDASHGLRAIIAIHNTTFGPAVGGTRMRAYPTMDDAARDALRLSRAMTHKAVMAEMPYGGGKAVIVGDPLRDKNEELLSAYARVVERLGGRFRTGADMGIDARDVGVLSRSTAFASHTPPGDVDTADLTALGVFESVAVAAEQMGEKVEGLSVAVQGLGQVGLRLARRLAEAGARLRVCDLDPGRVALTVEELGAEAVDPEAIYGCEVAIFSPNAAGSVLNDGTLGRLRCRAVVGAANEQLEEPRHGDALHARGILFAPDYVVNAGGLLSLLYESGEKSASEVAERVRGIGATLRGLLDRARREGLPPHRVADRIVAERLGKKQPGGAGG